MILTLWSKNPNPTAERYPLSVSGGSSNVVCTPKAPRLPAAPLFESSFIAFLISLIALVSGVTVS